MDETGLISIRQSSHNAAEELLARTRGIAERRKLRAWLYPTLMSLTFIMALIALGAAGYLEAVWPAFVALALVFGSGIWMWSRAERGEMRKVQALAACHDLRSIGGLLGFVNCGNRRVRNVVQQTLGALLPRVTEEAAAWLDTGHREILNSLLYGNSGELAMAALSALEQVGDVTALPYLTSIAAGKGIPSTLRHRQAEVQARAQRTVDMIRARIERHNRANVLLRASQVPGTPSEQLVRPANNLPLVDGRELLRPETGQETDLDQLDLDQQKAHHKEELL